MNYGQLCIETTYFLTYGSTRVSTSSVGCKYGKIRRWKGKHSNHEDSPLDCGNLETLVSFTNRNVTDQDLVRLFPEGQ